MASVRFILVSAALLILGSLSLSAQSSPSLQDVLRRVSRYVDAYGARASMFVGSERYTQQLSTERKSATPRTLTAEFAIVKAGPGDWIGFRDVFEVDGKAIANRRGRLQSLLTAPTGDKEQLRRIVAENVSLNIDPSGRGFNTPTTALFFLHPSTIDRFTFKQKGTKVIEGVTTWELDFKEGKLPPLIPYWQISGRVWVVPADGTIVCTQIDLRNVSGDRTVSPTATTSSLRDGGPPRSAGNEFYVPVATGLAAQGVGPHAGSMTWLPRVDPTALASSVTTPTLEDSLRPAPPQPSLTTVSHTEVTYRLDRQTGVWLPARMSEEYEGRIQGAQSFLGHVTGVAEYSGFKAFDGSRISLFSRSAASR